MTGTPQRILVVGCCGSGKSFTARRLHAVTGLPLVNLDKLFWLPGWKERSREDFLRLLRQELERETWIIDGNYSASLPLRLERCDQVIYLHLSRPACLWGVLSRALRYRGRVRADMAEGCPERLDRDFLKYTWSFEKQNGPKLRALLAGSGKPVQEIKSRAQLRRFLREQEKQHA